MFSYQGLASDWCLQRKWGWFNAVRTDFGLDWGINWSSVSESCCECICPLCRRGDLCSALQGVKMVPKPVKGALMSIYAGIRQILTFMVVNELIWSTKVHLQIDLTTACKKNTKPTAQPCSDISDLLFISFKMEIFFKNSGLGLLISFLPFFLMDLSASATVAEFPSSLVQDENCAAFC